MDDRDKLTKDELNLAEFPFTLPSYRAPKGITTIRVSELKMDKDNRPVQREWIVHPSGYGLPLATDEEVFLGLMYFLHRSDFRERTIYFTQHNLFRLLRWSGSQENYNRLELSLRRLKGAVIECKESFWDHKGKCYASHQFSLIDSLSLYRRELKSHDQPFISQVTFNEWIFDSFKSGFLKTLDLNLYLALKSPLARKLFRLLDKKLYRGETFEMELMRLANRLALTDNAYPSIVKKQLDRSAHPELEACGFLKSVRYIKRGNSTVIQYQMAPKTNWRLPAVEPRAVPQDDPLISELVARGLTRDVARTLLETSGPKVVADQLEVFDYLKSSKTSAELSNPAGFLRASIEKNYAAPAGYISRAERQRLKDAKAAEQRARIEHEAADAQANKEREAAFQQLWSGLSESDKETLEAQVLITLNEFTRKAYRSEKSSGKIGPGHHALKAGIQQLLESRQSSKPLETPSL